MCYDVASSTKVISVVGQGCSRKVQFSQVHITTKNLSLAGRRNLQSDMVNVFIGLADSPLIIISGFTILYALPKHIKILRHDAMILAHFASEGAAWQSATGTRLANIGHSLHLATATFK